MSAPMACGCGRRCGITSRFRLPGSRRRFLPQLDRLGAEKLLTPSEIEQIKKGPKDPSKPVIAPSGWMYWNVHLDGLEKTHDIIVEREGVFRECVLAMRMAKILGFQVATNTTVYRETDVAEIEHLFDFLSTLGVDGHTISPGYDYDAAKKDMAKRLGLDPANFFLTRRATIEKFSRATIWGKKYPLLGTPVYLEFVAGLRDLTCSAWAIPTRNIKGWKAPCYFMTDGHYAHLQRAAGESRLEQIRSCRWRRQRPSMRKLHGPVRLRTLCDNWFAR